MRAALLTICGLFAFLLAAFLVLRTPDSHPVAMRAAYGGPPSQFLELATGQTVHLRDEGPRDAPAIVLLHESNADLHTWEPWVRLLAERHRIVRFDQRGHGLTGPAHDGDYSPAAFALDVGALADRLGLERYVVAGNSMGGSVALTHALAAPNRLAGLVLISAAGAPVASMATGNLAFKLLQVPLLNRVLIEIMPRDAVVRSLRQSVSVKTVASQEAIDRYWQLARYPGNREATLARFGEDRRPFKRHDLAALDVPVLILWGEEDALIPAAHARWFENALGQSRLVTYPGIGHLAMEEAPLRSAADLARWLEEPEVRQRFVD
jgi:pimeloyl-ACP methyl ester carboxylesterase